MDKINIVIISRFLTPISNNIRKVFIEHHIVQAVKGESQGFRHFRGQKSNEKAK